MKKRNNNPEPKTKENILYTSLHLAVDMLQRQYDGMYEGYCGARRGGRRRAGRYFPIGRYVGLRRRGMMFTVESPLSSRELEKNREVQSKLIVHYFVSNI